MLLMFLNFIEVRIVAARTVVVVVRTLVVAELQVLVARRQVVRIVGEVKLPLVVEQLLVVHIAAEEVEKS
jgi:hypothetical protein